MRATMDRLHLNWRLAPLALTFFASLAVPADGPFKQLPAADVAAIRAVLDSTAKALKDKDGEAMRKLADVDAAVGAIERQKILGKLDAGSRKKLRQALESKMAQGLVDAAENAGWTDLSTRQIRAGSSENEAIATVRARTAEGSQARLRVWLTKSKAGWKLFDWEDDELPIRMTTIAGMLFPSEAPGHVSSRRNFPFVVQAAQCAADGDMDKAGQMLDRIHDTAFPPSVDSLRWLLCGLVESANGHNGEALKCFDKAEAQTGDMPSLIYHRALVHAKLNEIDRTLALAKTYVERFGDDAEVLALQADALIDLGRPAEAAAIYRRALAEDPASVAALAGLSQILPRADRGEIALRFSKLKEAGDIFPELAETLLEDKDDTALEGVIAAFRKLSPNEVLNDYYAAQLLVLRGDYDDAAKLLKASFPKVKDDDLRQQFGDRFIETLLLAKKPLEAYAGAPESKRAFRAVGEQLVKDEQAEQLEQLIARHRQRLPSDLWLPYFSGQLRMLRRQFDDAEKSFDEGMKAPIDDATRESYRSARVETMFLAGRALDALKLIGPEKKTFDQLATLAAKAEQDSVLQKLVDMHAKTQAGDADLGLWDAEILWLRRDYAKAAQTLSKHRLPISGRRSSNKQFIDRMVRSLLRCGDSAAALQEAQVYDHREKDPFYVAVALSNEKAVDNLFEAIRACVNHGYALDDLRGDPDIGRAMRAPKLRAMLEKLEGSK